MNLTPTRTGPVALPPLERLILRPNDLPGFRCLYAGAEDDTNAAVAARAADPERMRKRLETWGRLDGYAARFVPAARLADPAIPIVVDSSAARFNRGAGALQALTDDSPRLEATGAVRLYPRNIADDTECISEVFEEGSASFVLYRVDFRAGNVLGSVGAVWRRPYGSPLEALRLAQRQAERIRSALDEAGAAARSVTLPGVRREAASTSAGLRALTR